MERWGPALRASSDRVLFWGWHRAHTPLLPSPLSLPSLRMAEVVLGSQEPHVLWWGVIRPALCTCTELRASEMHEA